MAQEEQEPESEDVATDQALPARRPPEDPVLAAIVEPHDSASWTVGPDEYVIDVAPAEYAALVADAKSSGFNTFVDLCAVDYFRRSPRFEVVLNLLSHSQRRRLRVRCGIDGASPQVASVTDTFPGANFYEREAYDMFGIDFAGHPDLTRILMPDEWDGYPLRKDYAVGSVPVQFKDAHRVE